MRKLLSLMVAGAFMLALGACDEPVTTPEGLQVQADHGSSGEVTATAVYRAVDTKAARANGFEPGERIGTLHVTDDGSSLTVTGEVRGLDVVQVDGDLAFQDGDGLKGYWSLFYDKASSAQGNPVSDNAHPGASACEPGVFNPDHPLFLTLGQMAIGPGPFFKGVSFFPGFDNFPGQAAWDVAEPDGTATLGPASTLEYVPVKDIGTVSIRDGRFLDEARQGDPEQMVVACGVVTHAPAN